MSGSMRDPARYPDEVMQEREAGYAAIRRRGGLRPHVVSDSWSFTSGGRARDLPLPGGWSLRLIVEMRDDTDRVELSVGPADEIHSAWRIVLPADALEAVAQMFLEEAGSRQEWIERASPWGSTSRCPNSRATISSASVATPLSTFRTRTS